MQKSENREYATEVGFPHATYLESSREELPPIGVEHRSKAVLGKGTFGEVHKALNIRDGEGFVIKVRSGGGESEMKENSFTVCAGHGNLYEGRMAKWVAIAMGGMRGGPGLKVYTRVFWKEM